MSVSTDQSAQLEAFVREYYRWLAPEDLEGRAPADVRGAALAHARLAHRRAPGEAKVRVYNPTPDQDGWQSTHTVAEVVNDDMPFLVDSITMELSRQGHRIHQPVHTVIGVRRGEDSELLEVLPPEAGDPGAPAESIVHVEIDRVSDPAQLDALRDDLLRILGDVRAAVEDWPLMRERVHELATELESEPSPLDPAEVEEAGALLAWLDDGNFTFLGFRDYDLIVEDGTDRLRAVEGSGLGILRQAGGRPESHSFDKLPPRARALARTKRLLNLTKADSRATVHRPDYLDYIGVKRFAADGEVLGERRVLGLYTTAAYRQSPREVPIVRRKVDAVLARTDFPPGGHDDKALVEILETHPLDELLQISEDELAQTAMGIVRLGERQRVRLFVRRDEYERFLSCLVFLPRDRFNTHNRLLVQEILRSAFDAERIDFELRLTASVLVRIHFVVRTRSGELPEHDRDAIEARIAAATRSWEDDLGDALHAEHGDARGDELSRRYGQAFPAAYRDDWPAPAAVADIARLERLEADGRLGLHLYRPEGTAVGALRCKLLRSDGPVALSEVLPMFEHMGLQVADERPYEIRPAEGDGAWICDFGLRCDAKLDAAAVREDFEDAFVRVWRAEVDDDGFNGLVLRARLTWREIAILRAVARYLRQLGITFSDRYMQQALMRHPDVARGLVELFVARFDPARAGDADTEALQQRIEAAVDAISSLDEDRILSAFLAVVRAMLRTNYFQRDADGAPKPHLAFKLDPTRIGLAPAPRPRFEIFVDAPWTEGVHLRGGKVARGGLRWSDRREDFRTEVLGLMKAQMVKNAVIVPVGAKGGFVVKHPPAEREALAREVERCYRTFIRGLLDLTDNVVGGEIAPPPDVVRYDDDDPYLVVAADKGTATFSDVANELAAEYGFWLGDAFASGGSVGYDHKRMGITARGAWESVKRHFRELDLDTQAEDFTVVGVGDMSGDVFGNGTLLSEHIRLVGAFDHRHVFVDPDPDPAAGFAERRRLFALERSTWADYDTDLISRGGGVWPRTAKSIELTDEIRRALDVDAERMTPSELIRALLRAPVDLLFNGGIGTYVKARAETHAEVGDKANDAVRVDGSELRCRVVGEGGNLGLTQLGRVDFALGGGRINTDAIDNAAGVNCSDYEVNIKILLGSVVAAGELDARGRDALLAEMTDAVAELVLRDNRAQALALSLARVQAPEMLDVHDRFLRSLEQAGRLDRALERLPDAEAIGERASARGGLTQPELAVVFAYSKITLYEQLLDSDLPEDAFLWRELARSIPPPLPDRYGTRMRDHRLRREIVATHVTNSMVNRAGTTFAFRMREDTGAAAPAIARAYAVARVVFALPDYWDDVAALDRPVDVETQLGMLLQGRKLVERATRWLLRNQPDPLDVAEAVQRFAPGARALADALPGVLVEGDREGWDETVASLTEAAVPAPLARRAASLEVLFAALDVVEVSDATGQDLDAVAALHLLVGARLRLHWLRDQIAGLPRATRWEAMARAALRDDVFSLHARLTADVAASGAAASGAPARLDAWTAANGPRLQRCEAILDDITATGAYDLTTLPVALREVRDLAASG